VVIRPEFSVLWLLSTDSEPHADGAPQDGIDWRSQELLTQGRCIGGGRQPDFGPIDESRILKENDLESAS
jgi:hypothetical protein